MELLRVPPRAQPPAPLRYGFALGAVALALSVARDHPGLAILLMTGFADQRERAFGLDSLVSDVVSKPFTLAEIRAAVGRALAGRSPSTRIA